jgi:hypothetical protein
LLAFIDAFRAAEVIATDFGEPVEPVVVATKAIDLSIFFVETSIVDSAGPDPLSASANFSCNLGIDHSGRMKIKGRSSFSSMITVDYFLYKNYFNI